MFSLSMGLWHLKGQVVVSWSLPVLGSLNWFVWSFRVTARLSWLGELRWDRLLYALRQTNSFNSFEFVSDSRSLLFNVLAATKIPPLFLYCRSIILSMTTPLKFVWIIELAKTLSREAASLKEPSDICIDPPPSVRKSALKDLLWDNWNREWVSSTSGSNTRSFFPSADSIPPFPSFHFPYQLTHLITGHSKLNFHQHRYKFINSPACRCGAQEETIDHHLFHCPIFELARSTFKASCIFHLSAWPPLLSKIPSSPPVWSNFISFITTSTRLDWSIRLSRHR